MGGHDLDMSGKKLGRNGEGIGVLDRGKAAGPNGIMTEMLMYGEGGGKLVEVMLLMMNMVMKSECCQLDWKTSLMVPLTNMVMWNK